MYRLRYIQGVSFVLIFLASFRWGGSLSSCFLDRWSFAWGLRGGYSCLQVFRPQARAERKGGYFGDDWDQFDVGFSLDQGFGLVVMQQGFPLLAVGEVFGACSEGMHACWCAGLAPLRMGLGCLIGVRVRIGVRDWGQLLVDQDQEGITQFSIWERSEQLGIRSELHIWELLYMIGFELIVHLFWTQMWMGFFQG